MSALRLTESEIEELAQRGQHLARPDGLPPQFDSEEAGQAYRDRTLGLTARGVAAMSAMVANGGLPSKPSKGKSRTDLWWRIAIVGGILGLYLSRGNEVHIGTDGVTITPTTIIKDGK